MRIGVTGDRNWQDDAIIYDALDALLQQHGPFTLVEGCAKGADRISEEWALVRGLEPDHHPALWDYYRKLGRLKAAGPIRNQEMVDSGLNFVIAFHPDIVNSKGTKDMIDRCKKAGIKGILYTGKET